MTGTTVIDDRVRVILDDTDASAERWTDAMLIAWLNDGGRLIADLRPDATMATPYTQTAWSDITVLGDTVALPDRYRECLVDYICSKALSQDAQDERDLARSRYHYEQFFIKGGLPSQTSTTRGRSA